ncbi:ribose-phosphate pyrophosphokinase [Fusobacterium polymorphum]|uniref:ribose-phosphate pyrophosphokinase n=1 Tax=Fusobacterium nucleatum subsp. polymorphum TaxID=76857 RepID=UPI0021C35786|nr:ribose-phosphate pyrophosphokinase [Fusobacterium polymorphum]
MAEYTKYLRLMKPQGNEYYNVENFNHNAELIDKETEKLNDAVTEIKNGATREKAGIVQFGTEEGKALEGMMLARLAGCVGYGGDIQTAGVKDVNYIYYDRNTRKMYKCLNQNSDVSANVANFVPLDNNSLLDRLENLFKYSEIFKGRAATKGQTLGTIPSNSKFIEIIGINYADDNNFYYFTPIILRTEIIRNRDIAFTVGITSDTREFVLSFKNNVITITHSTVTNSTSDNNFIAQILSVNS